MPSAKPAYLPRNLPLSHGRGYKMYEFLVVWRHEFDSLTRILDVFAKNKAKVVLAHSQLDEYTSADVGTFHCDLAPADKSADEIKREIEGLAFVQRVDVASLEHSLFDKFLFPVLIMGRRVLVMRLEPLLGIEKSLTQELGSAGGTIMFREGESYASETIAQYRVALGKVTDEDLMANVIDGLRATGWGVFDFRTKPAGYEVTVDGAMETEASLPSRFLCGIIAGILETVYGGRLKVDESTVDSRSGRVVVRLSSVSSGGSKQGP
jgi:hypothetical protein